MTSTITPPGDALRPRRSASAVSSHAPGAVVLVRPSRFAPNPLTRADNAFQKPPSASAEVVARAAHSEVTAAAETLRAHGVVVHLFEDDDVLRPDSVFPNNWFSTHADGRVAVFPLFAPNRRAERRDDVLDLLRERYQVREIVDYTGYEREGQFLEGTGAMVLDHEQSLAFTARSRRADPLLLEAFCRSFGYRPVLFDAADAHGTPIYHTNVMLSVGSEIALIASDLIGDPVRRAEVETLLAADGRREIVRLSLDQIRAFTGNALELDAGGHRLLAMSARGAAALTPAQRRLLDRHVELLPIPVPTVELAGGSVRCMIAGIHLPPREEPGVHPGEGQPFTPPAAAKPVPRLRPMNR